MSITGLVLLVGCFIGLLAVIAAPIILALFIAGLALRLVFFVLFLPFRLLGGVFGLGFSFVGWVLRSFVLLGGLGILLLLGLLPLLPFLLIAGGAYLVFRAMRPRAAPVARA